MIALNGSQYLKVKLGSVVTTNELPVLVSYIDQYFSTERTTKTPTSVGSLTNGTAYIDALSGQEANTSIIKHICIKNNDTTSKKVYVSYFEDILECVLIEVTLAVRDTLTYDEDGWKVVDSQGRLKTIGSGGSCAAGTVENSDASYTDSVPSGGLLVLPDEVLNIYASGVLNFTGLYVPLSNQTINITF